MTNSHEIRNLTRLVLAESVLVIVFNRYPRRPGSIEFIPKCKSYFLHIVFRTAWNVKKNNFQACFYLSLFLDSVTYDQVRTEGGRKFVLMLKCLCLYPLMVLVLTWSMNCHLWHRFIKIYSDFYRYTFIKLFNWNVNSNCNHFGESVFPINKL